MRLWRVINQAQRDHRLRRRQELPGLGAQITPVTFEITHLAVISGSKPLWVEGGFERRAGGSDTDKIEAGFAGQGLYSGGKKLDKKLGFLALFIMLLGILGLSNLVNSLL